MKCYVSSAYVNHPASAKMTPSCSILYFFFFFSLSLSVLLYSDTFFFVKARSYSPANSPYTIHSTNWHAHHAICVRRSHFSFSFQFSFYLCLHNAMMPYIRAYVYFTSLYSAAAFSLLQLHASSVFALHHNRGNTTFTVYIQELVFALVFFLFRLRVGRKKSFTLHFKLCSFLPQLEYNII